MNLENGIPTYVFCSIKYRNLGQTNQKKSHASQPYNTSNTYVISVFEERQNGSC